MTTQPKSFDCIAMKEAIQARLAEKWDQMSDEEISRWIADELETSEEPLAQWWRRATTTQATDR